MTLLLVSNRLPVSLRRIGNRLDVQPNPGGVAAGLAAFYREYKARWFGWPGEVLPSETGEVAARLEKEFDCRPVFLPRKIARAYYAGFSNGTLWPLFHSFATYARYSASELPRLPLPSSAPSPASRRARVRRSSCFPFPASTTRRESRSSSRPSDGSSRPTPNGAAT